MEGVSRLRSYWLNDLRRLRAIRRVWRTVRMAALRRRLGATRALMDLQVVRSKTELLDYDPTLQGYRWVLISKPLTRRWL